VTPVAIDADGSNTARATITSLTIGQTRITATVDNVTAETSAQFTTAYPDRVFVAPDKSTLANNSASNSTTIVKVTLLRNIGTVSSPLAVTYTAITNTGAPIGSFSGVSLATAGVSTATFNLGTTTYVGPVTITATVEGGATSSATVQVTGP
jgi:hypothetical protein